jgi:hypothetical protein
MLPEVLAELSQSFRFHDLRHTGATLLLRQGVKPEVRAGASRIRRLEPYPQCLYARAPGHGRCCRRSDGCRARIARWCQKAPVMSRGYLVFLHFAGLSGVCLEGFEPPTRGLGMRTYGSHTILACQQIPLIYAVFSDSGASVFLLCSTPFCLGCSTVTVHLLLRKGGVVEYNSRDADP